MQGKDIHIIINLLFLLQRSKLLQISINFISVSVFPDNKFNMFVFSLFFKGKQINLPSADQNSPYYVCLSIQFIFIFYLFPLSWDVQKLKVTSYNRFMYYYQKGGEKPQQQSKEWTWMDCNLTLKRASKKNQNQVFEILESEYTVQLEEDESQTELNIEITMEKRINYQEDSGFTWHKSWNIPSIEVKISRRDLNAIKTQLGIGRVYCEITSGYPIRKMVEFFIQEVTLQGETRKQIGANGVARFSNLKFSQTSFNHERNKFSLILIIFTKNEQRSRSVLKSFISMPIYVDSRKEARKKVPINNFLADLIPIKQFLKDLELRHEDKKPGKLKSRKSIEQNGDEEKRRGKYLIDYSLNGFLRYYSSANIRNKIKHPFYFCYHFRNMLTLYLNKQVAKNPLDLLRILQKPLKHDAKKLILIALTPSKEEQGENSQELKKKFINLFENWKYFFVEVVVKGSLYFNFMQQEKVGSSKDSDEQQNKKWIEVSCDELFDSYNQYFTEVENRENEQRKISAESQSPQPQQHSGENEKRYQHFELHQTICIQNAFKNAASSKKVKIQHQEQS